MQGFDHHHSIVDSAKLAKETKAKKLALIHISRKEDIGKELIEAKKIYSPITAPEDLTAIKI
jgi:ribonuclease BN (tRNA processing enzyme)